MTMNTNTKQSDMILGSLTRGDRLTQLDALTRFGCMRLSSRVHELRQRGHNIVCRMVHSNGKTYAEYHLEGAK